MDLFLHIKVMDQNKFNINTGHEYSFNPPNILPPIIACREFDEINNCRQYAKDNFYIFKLFIILQFLMFFFKKFDLFY